MVLHRQTGMQRILAGTLALILGGNALPAAAGPPGGSCLARLPVPGGSIAAVHYQERKVSLVPPVGLGLILGCMGFLAGQSIQGDSDWGTAASRKKDAILLPVLGLATGFGLGLGVSYFLTRPQEHAIRCEEPAAGP